MVFFYILLYMCLMSMHFMFVVIVRGKIRDFRDPNWDDFTPAIAVVSSVFFVFSMWFTIPLYLYKLRKEKNW